MGKMRWLLTDKLAAATLSGATAAEDYPVERVHNAHIRQTYRTVNATHGWLQWEFAAPTTVSAFFLGRINWTPTANVSLWIADDDTLNWDRRLVPLNLSVPTDAFGAPLGKCASWNLRADGWSYSGTGPHGQAESGGVVSYNGYLWSFIRRKVYRSTDGRVWAEVGTDAMPGDLLNHRAVVFNNAMWLIGGFDYTTTPPTALRKVWSSADGTTWTEAGTNALPSARNGHEVCVYNNAMWLTGGTDSTAKNVYTSTDGSTWTDLGATLPDTNNLFGFVAFQDALWVLGGYVNNWPSPAGPSAAIYRSTDGITWRQCGALPSPVYGHACVVLEDKLWIVGGNGPSNARAYWSTDGTTWHLASLSVRPAASQLYGAVHRQRGFALGGGWVFQCWETPYVRQMRLVFADPANTDGYLEIGRALAGTPTTLSQNISDGFTLRRRDISRGLVRPGLNGYWTPSDQFDVIECRFNRIPESQHDTLRAAFQRAGGHTPFVLTLDPDRPHHSSYYVQQAPRLKTYVQVARRFDLPDVTFDEKV